MKWKAEGGKELLWIATRTGLCKRKVFVREKAVFEDSKKLIEQAMFWLRKREAFEGKASSFLQMENFCFAEKGCFFQLMQS